MAQYNITVQRTVIQDTVISVDTELSEEGSRQLALARAEVLENSEWAEIETYNYEVTDVV